MMTRQTVDQILQVFRLFRDNFEKRGKHLQKSYRDAVREVANQHSVTYQTIGDGCRRRLKLNDIHELYALLRRWVEGDPEPLENQLKAASGPSTHIVITEFFGSSRVSAKAQSQHNGIATSEEKFDTFSFRLPESHARRLRAVAEIKGVSPPEMLSQLVRVAVTEEFKLVAQEIIHDSGGEPNESS